MQEGSERNRNYLSQIPYFVRSALSRQLHDNFHTISDFRYPLQEVLRGRAFVFRHLLKQPWLSDRSLDKANWFAKQTLKRIPDKKCVIINKGTTLAASDVWRNSPHSLVTWTDATIHQMINYWPGLINPHQNFILEAEKIEQRAYQNARHLIFCNHWAALSAIRDYHIPKEKVHVIENGANLPTPPSWDEIERRIDERSARLLEKPVILSIGTCWHRKGMDQLIRMSNSLKNSGTDHEVHIIGCNPPRGVLLPLQITTHGKLDKFHTRSWEKFDTLMKRATLFVLLSRQETFGSVFSEAAAYGLPRIGRLTGGVESAVQHEKNGLLFPPSVSTQAISETIAHLLHNREKYIHLARNARSAYDHIFQWDIAASRFLNIVRENKPSAPNLSNPLKPPSTITS